MGRGPLAPATFIVDQEFTHLQTFFFFIFFFVVDMIAVEEDIASIYNGMKMSKEHKYAIFKMTDDWLGIVVDYRGESRSTLTKEEDKAVFAELSARLSDDQPRYVLYDFRFTDNDGRITEKIAFLFWWVVGSFV